MNICNYRPQRSTPPPPSGSRLRHTVNEQSVRILLECILVCGILLHIHERLSVRIWKQIHINVIKQSEMWQCDICTEDNYYVLMFTKLLPIMTWKSHIHMDAINYYEQLDLIIDWWRQWKFSSELLHIKLSADDTGYFKINVLCNVFKKGICNDFTFCMCRYMCYLLLWWVDTGKNVIEIPVLRNVQNCWLRFRSFTLLCTKDWIKINYICTLFVYEM